MAQDEPRLRRTRRHKKYWVMGAIVVIAVTSYVAYRRMLTSGIEARLNAVRAAGYPATLRELDDWYVYPTGKNAALVYQQAFAKFHYDRESDWAAEWPMKCGRRLPTVWKRTPKH